MTRTIAVISGKGGVGKTTVALNLGAAIANRGKRVTIVDCNVTTSHVGLHLGMYYHPTNLNKVLKDEAEINEAVHEHHTGLKIVPASLSLSELQGVDMSKMREKLEALKQNNDIIILDSGPGLGREAMSCLKAADEVIYVTTPYVPSVMDIVRCKEVVSELNIRELGIVVNMVENDRHEMNKEEIEQLTRLPVVVRIPNDKNVKRSLSKKLPVVAYKPKSKSSKVFREFAAKVIGEGHGEGSLFKRLFGSLKI